MNRAGAVVATVALGTLAGCDGAPRNLVEDAAAPTILQPSDVHVLGTSDAIATVEDLEVLPNGAVWVLNSVEPLFIGFGPDGDALQAHGDRGGGPGEFGMPVGFVSGGIGGEAWVLDLRRHALIEISRPRATRSEISLPRDSIPPGTLKGGVGMMINRVRTARLGNEIILARSFGAIRDGMFSFWLSIWGADLVAVDPATASVRGVIGLGEILGDPMAHLEQTGGFPPFPLWLRLWAVCSDSQIRVYDRLRNEVRAFTGDGRELDATPLPPPSFDEVTDEQFARAVFGLVMAERLGAVGARVSPADSARLLNEMVQQVEGAPDQLASFLPRVVDMRCAEDGTLWIQPIDIDLGELRGGLAWLRIAPDGVAREVHLPDRFDAYRFAGGRIWGVQRDEFDVASVAWIDVPGTH